MLLYGIIIISVFYVDFRNELSLLMLLSLLIFISVIQVNFFSNFHSPPPDDDSLNNVEFQKLKGIERSTKPHCSGLTAKYRNSTVSCLHLFNFNFNLITQLAAFKFEICQLVSFRSHLSVCQLSSLYFESDFVIMLTIRIKVFQLKVANL